MPGKLTYEGRWFRDEAGRRVLLRGVNLGGDCKVPFPDGGTQHPTDFTDHREVSFVGRPFPLDEAAEHFARLRRWGFGFLRLLTTWEAVEHGGPGVYDEDYLDYYEQLCRLAGEHGFVLFVDFHQDVWSRMTGGDGAPGWVFEAVGLDITRLGVTDAALVMQGRYDYADERREQPERYPRMCWSENYSYPANGILWTLFFAGRLFTPDFVVEGVNVQDFLQGHYLAAQRKLAERLVAMPHVLGFGTLNEPSRGWVGRAMSDRRMVDRPGQPAKPGLAWAPIDALYSCDGHPVDVPELRPRWYRGKCVPVRTVTANPRGARLWLPGREDPFEEAGAWRIVDDRPEVLREHYFCSVDGREEDFDRDCLVPFFDRVASNARALRDDWLIFAEKDAYDAMVEPGFGAPLPDRTVAAPHWYDVVKLLLKRGTPMTLDPIAKKLSFGRGGVRRSYLRQLTRLRDAAGDRPTVLGEFGIPFDMEGGEAYRAFAEGDRTDKPWKPQIRTLELMYDALDALQLHSTQWNYTASNRNDSRVGDGWNQEDLSIFSPDQRADPSDPDSGGRALPALVRPYAPAVAGLPEPVTFHRKKGRFELRWQADPAIDAPTEVFVPGVQYPDGFDVTVEPEADLAWDPQAQLLRIRVRQGGEHRLQIRRGSVPFVV